MYEQGKVSSSQDKACTKYLTLTDVGVVVGVLLGVDVGVDVGV